LQTYIEKMQYHIGIQLGLPKNGNVQNYLYQSGWPRPDVANDKQIDAADTEGSRSILNYFINWHVASSKAWKTETAIDCCGTSQYPVCPGVSILCL
jgi:hypothetical protein